MFFLAGVLFALHTLGRAWNGSSSALANVTDAFTKAKIVPDVIPTFSPNASLSPIFTGSSGPIQVLPGMSLNVNDIKTAPQYLLASNTTDLSMSNTSWVVTIVDSDASPPQFLHFLGQDFVVDPNLVVQGGGLMNATGLMNMSQALAEYVSPNPPSGPSHRYVVLVYKQPSDFNTTAPAFFNSTNGTDINRQGFSISHFATNTSLGDPIAGSFFLVGAADADTTSSTAMTSSSTASVSPSPIPPIASTPTSVPLPPSPSSSASQEPAATTTNVPSGAERATSWMSLLVITTLSVGLVLI